MNRLNELIKSDTYKKYLRQIAEAERERIFCKHDTAHFLDVSRLLYIYCLQENLFINKEILYAIGFLHDIGRARQYTDGIEHHKASVDIAAVLLPKYGFDENETGMILKAIASHRHSENSDTLSFLTYKADKKSRNCCFCSAADECNWSSGKMNMSIDL